MYLERNDAKRALSKLQVCFQANPKDVATLELLARAFHVLGQHAKTISVYREIARIYQDGKRPAERERVLRKILELDPNDDEAKTALGQKPPAARDASSLFEVPPGTIMAPPNMGAALGAEPRAPQPAVVQAPVASAPKKTLVDEEPEMEFLDDDMDDVEEMVDELNLDDAADDDAEILIEPDSDDESEPAIFLEAARRLGAEATVCLAFEDSDIGALSAKRAGMTVVQVPDRQKSRGENAHHLAIDLLAGARMAGLI